MTNLTVLQRARDDAQCSFMIAGDAAKHAIEQREQALDEWSKARIAYSTAKGHPLAGKRVVTTAKRHKWSANTKTVQITGIVTLHTGIRQGFHIRSYQPIPGEWYVASTSGATGYRLDDADGACLWEAV